MKLPRDLSGAELIKLLCKQHGYRRVNQEGSHVVLETDFPRHHRLARPHSNTVTASCPRRRNSWITGRGKSSSVKSLAMLSLPRCIHSLG